MDEKLQLFDAGLVLRSVSAWKALKADGVSEWSLLERHQAGDFGEVGPAQRRSNLAAINGERAHRARVFSAYRLRRSFVWVVTDFDADITTMLMPREYAPHRRAARATFAPASPRLRAAA